MQKITIQQLLDELPDVVEVDALIERLYLLQKIELAEQQLAAGEGIPHAEAKQQMARWRESLGHRAP